MLLLLSQGSGQKEVPRTIRAWERPHCHPQPYPGGKYPNGCFQEQLRLFLYLLDVVNLYQSLHGADINDPGDYEDGQ